MSKQSKFFNIVQQSQLVISLVHRGVEQYLLEYNHILTTMFAAATSIAVHANTIAYYVNKHNLLHPKLTEHKKNKRREAVQPVSLVEKVVGLLDG